MATKDDTLLLIAALLSAAAYLFFEDDADASADSSTAAGNTVSGNGFAINNPLNLRYISADPFNGQTGNHNGYGVYSTLSLGVRAAGLQLSAYVARGLTTITQIVSTWAPSSENNTAAYIADVSQRTGISADEPLSWPEDEVSLIQAMAYHENGYNDMSDTFVQQAISS